MCTVFGDVPLSGSFRKCSRFCWTPRATPCAACWRSCPDRVATHSGPRAIRCMASIRPPKPLCACPPRTPPHCARARAGPGRGHRCSGDAMCTKRNERTTRDFCRSLAQISASLPPLVVEIRPASVALGLANWLAACGELWPDAAIEMTGGQSNPVDVCHFHPRLAARLAWSDHTFGAIQRQVLSAIPHPAEPVRRQLGQGRSHTQRPNPVPTAMACRARSSRPVARTTAGAGPTLRP